MLITFIILAALAAFALLFILRRRRNIVYKRRVLDRYPGYSVSDHPSTSELTQHVWFSPDEHPNHSNDDPLTWGGGEFGGSGAGDSYDAGSDTGQSGGDSGPSTDDSWGCSAGSDTNW